MWPFGKTRHTKSMVKVIFTDGKVIKGEDRLGEDLYVGMSWIRHDRGGETVLYPHSRVHRVLFWEEEEK